MIAPARQKKKESKRGIKHDKHDRPTRESNMISTNHHANHITLALPYVNYDYNPQIIVV